MVASTAYNYEADPDINAFAPKKKTTSAVESIPTVAPKKSTMSGKNPELQFNDYENDPDIVAFTPGKHNISPIQEAPIPNGPVHQMLVRHLTERQKAEQYLKNQENPKKEKGKDVQGAVEFEEGALYKFSNGVQKRRVNGVWVNP